MRYISLNFRSTTKYVTISFHASFDREFMKFGSITRYFVQPQK